jgi:prepilin-type N-terminal cleavage/methylation domain-containing protein/prepilin-type processing-associated H-X9-DG protein
MQGVAYFTWRAAIPLDPVTGRQVTKAILHLSLPPADDKFSRPFFARISSRRLEIDLLPSQTSGDMDGQAQIPWNRHDRRVRLMDSRHRSRSRVAFTLIELLVVIAIIGVLIALLLPAVQKVREAANRTSCLNNLKQMGVGLHGYHDTNGSFPPGVYPSYDSAVRHCWTALILPHMEQAALRQQYRIDKNWSAPENAAVIAIPIPIFQCPSASRNRKDVKFYNAATMDYGALDGSAYETVKAGFLPSSYQNQEQLDGVLMWSGKKYRITDISDGSSQTVLVGEDAGRPERWEAGQHSPSTYTSGGGWADPESEFWLHGYSQDGKSSPGPCAINCSNNNEVYGFHLGGANLLFADGSARWMRGTISMATLAALISRSGGEVVGEDY